jgi:MFS family permease
MLAGIVAYTARCLIFAVVFGFGLPFEGKLALAALGQALHGFCFGCFLAAAFMYIDRAVGKDLRGSMQTLYGTTVLGIGFFVGGWIGGRVGEVFTTGAGAEPFRRMFGVTGDAGIVAFTAKDNEVLYRDWPGVWLTCAIIAAVALAIFAAAFPRTPGEESD